MIGAPFNMTPEEQSAWRMANLSGPLGRVTITEDPFPVRDTTVQNFNEITGAHGKAVSPWRNFACVTRKGRIHIDMPAGGGHAHVLVEESYLDDNSMTVVVRVYRLQMPRLAAVRLALEANSHPNAGWDP